ncbi:hypothetical protein TRICHSKD4_0499 [Roseibium sp. TrichSKD4]|uniref:hypothetical protein n=1 Tax=Roseibium sp. TrichSKD4 TaxID=744980 RepID=UPI0001E564EB|nr:hypothetical protein [Roseibium sp. TrichSKD4]EFO34202.1 hypothetical protein TRICHSKD4_0499 [Roseibium sp. TrichSKD4]
MKLPYQAPSINREDRINSAIDSSVAPAFWGALASAAAPIAIDLGKKALRGLLR